MIDKIEAPSPIAPSSSSPAPSAFAAWWTISCLWFQSRYRLQAISYVVFSIFLSIITTALLLKVSSVQNSLHSSLSEKIQSEFHAAIFDFLKILVIAAPLFALHSYVGSRIAIAWRSWLTQWLIQLYFSQRAYFRLKLSPSSMIDNPDQRICDDIRSYAATSVGLAVGLVRQLFYCIAFTGLLLSVAPGLVLFLLGYALFGTLLTTFGFGRRLTVVAVTLLQKEADLRFDLMRVREHAESIAFYRAGDREKDIAMSRLAEAINLSTRQAKIEALLVLWQHVYSYVTILLPILLMAPKYFSGDVRFGTITQVSFAFSRIETALSYMIDHMTEISNLQAQTSRLHSLISALSTHVDDKQRITCIRNQHNATALLQVRHLVLKTPDGERTLCANLEFSLADGQSLLIEGPSGVGKSSLARALAGLWSRGSGSITTLPLDDIFFLPQKPYMPLGSLREQLAFPHNSTNFDDAKLVHLLKTVALDHLIDKLDAVLDWSHTLSLGEQQRLAFARLLLRQPIVAVLDEATSGLDEPTEAALYAALQQSCRCYISIGHRKHLRAVHTHILQATNTGYWTFTQN